MSSDVPPPLPSPAESLRTQFYEWEKRGRGWQVWNEPAYLEPPFRPFIHVYVPPARIDDARRPSLISSFIERASSLWSGKRSEEALDPGLVALLQEPTIPPYEDEVGLVEIQVVLPPSAKISHETFQSFLLSLAFCASPLSFEVIGSAKEIVIQLVARESDIEDVAEQLRSHFPDVTMKVAPKYLQKLWFTDEDLPGAVVDFGLSEEFMLPLRTLSSANDPLVAITGALAKLGENEVGVFQVLFESVRYPWAESIFRAVTDNEGEAFFENAPEMVALAKEKIRSPLFAAVIRVAAKAEEEDRVWQIVRNLGGGLAAVKRPTVNELIPLENDGYDDIRHEANLLVRLSNRSGMLLNSDELVSLVHLPTPAVMTKKLVRRTGRTKPAPRLVIGHSTVLGGNSHEGETQSATLSTDQRVKHMHVIGVPGTGKSTFLQNLILQDIEQGHGVAVLDPHGDLIDQILERVKEERREDVILFDPSDADFPIGFNILSAHSEIEKNLLASDLVGVFQRLSTSWGDQMTSVLANAILAFLESDCGGTLADLRRFLIEKDYREEFLKSVQDPQVTYYWRKEFPLLTGGKSLGPLLTRLNTFLRHKFVRNMVAQKENRIDFRKVMDEGKIFLAKLSQGAIGEENTWLLGSLLVSKFHQIALARQDVREETRRPYFLYADEFHNFITPSMAQILSGARKYRLGLVLAHQELRQLGGAGSEMGSSVLSNPYTRVCFRLGDEDARKLESGFSFFEAKDFQNLGTGEAIARVEKAEFDFNLTTPPLAALDKQGGRVSREAIIEHSRSQFGTLRTEVQAELARQIGMNDVEEVDSKPKRKAQPKAAGESFRDKSENVEAKAIGQDEIEMEKPPLESSVTSIATSPPSNALVHEEPQKTSILPKAQTRSPLQADPPMSSEPRALGRGDTRHTTMQKEFALWARGMGWLAEIESKLPDSLQAVDLHMEKAGVSVACEFPMTSTVKDEIKNIRKCLRTGYQHIAVISENSSRLNQISEAARTEISSDEFARVQFLPPDGFKLFVAQLEASLSSTDLTVLGYQYKRVYRSSKTGNAPSRGENVRGILSEELLTKAGKKRKKEKNV